MSYKYDRRRDGDNRFDALRRWEYSVRDINFNEDRIACIQDALNNGMPESAVEDGLAIGITQEELDEAILRNKSAVN